MSITLNALQKQRTDTAANWTSANPTLLAGELGFESDTGKVKLGTGSTAWTSLGYLGVIPSSGTYPLSQLIMPLGTAGAPPLTFVGDVNTGIYSPGADQVSVSTGGTERLRISSTGQIQAVSLGTAAAPAWSFTGDPNTGIYSPGADQVAISTNGSGRLFINSTGIVSVGTGTPNATAGGFDISSGGIGLVVGADGSVSTRTNATDKIFRIGSAHYTNAEEPVCIAFGQNLNSDNELNFGGGTAALNAATYIRFFTAANNTTTGGTERMRLDSSGRLGVGTSSPGSVLHVVGTTTLNATQSFIANSATGSYATFQHNGTSIGDIGTGNQVLSGGTTTDLALTPRSTGSLVFGINSSERARIDSSGRLLVGTSSSASAGDSQYARIQIRGNTLNAGGAGLFSIQRGEAAADITSGERLGTIAYADNSGNEFASITCEADANAGSGDYPGRLVFSTTADGASSPTERLRIANDGRHTINSNAHQGTALSTTAPAKLYTSTGTYTDTATAASGTVAHGPVVAFDNPAIAATNVTVTYTNASTVYIDGAPTAGTNVTITNAFALFVAAGASRFGGSILSSNATAGIGYATGAGGAITQATSRTTGVTLNTICGAITLVSAAGTAAWQSFTVTNSAVAATDNVIVNQKSGTDLYMIHVTNVAAGSFRITYATTGGTTTEQPVFNFSVIKAVAA